MVCFSHTAITISSSCQHISRLHSHSTFTRVQHQRPPAADFPLASTHTREAPPTQHTIPAHMDSFHPRSDTRLHLLSTLILPTWTVPTHTMTSTGDLTVNRKNTVMPMVLLILQCCTGLHKGHYTFTHSIIKCWQMFKILLWRVINNTQLMASFPDNPDKVAEEDKAIMDLIETKRWDGIGISWTTYILFAPWSGQMTMPAPFQSVFQAKCSSWWAAKSVRTLCSFLENLVHMCDLQLCSGRFLTDRFLWESHAPGSKRHILQLWIL